MRVGALPGQADAIAKREAAPVAAVDANKGPLMTAEGGDDRDQVPCSLEVEARRREQRREKGTPVADHAGLGDRRACVVREAGCRPAWS